VEGDEVILKTVLLFNQCTATLQSPEAYAGKQIPIQRLSANQLIERYPHLRTPVQDQWGVMSSYLVFPALKSGDELKIVLTMPDYGKQVPLYVRKIDESER